MQIKIVCRFSMGKGGERVVGNGVMVFGVRALNTDSETEALKMIGQ